MLGFVWFSPIKKKKKAVFCDIYIAMPRLQWKEEGEKKKKVATSFVWYFAVRT